MGLYVNPENESFFKSINSLIYIDKSMLIDYTNSVINTEQKCICVTRPRRFGKSMAAKMLSAYYSKGCDSKELFSNLKIAKTANFEKELNKHCVITFDVQEMYIKAKYLKLNVLEYMQCEIIEELSEEFPSIVDTNIHFLPEILLRIYKKTKTKFIIIMDEWDCYLREEKDNSNLINSYLDFLRNMFKGLVAEKVIELAYLTGILPIKQYDVQSTMNNFFEYTMLNPYPLEEFVGFTDEEVRNICNLKNINYEETKRWYNGYKYNTVGSLYNPNSVCQAILRRHFANYWMKTGSYDSIKNLIEKNIAGLRDTIIALLGGEQIEVAQGSFKNDLQNIKTKNDVLILLVHLGYLAYDEENKMVYIPNKEIAEEFQEAVKDADWGNISEILDRSRRLLEETIKGNAQMVAEILELAHQDETSVLSYNNEESLACAINIAYYYARTDYYMIRECPTGKGYADLMLIPSQYCNKPALVIELKVDQTPETGIQQIKNKNYPQKLANYIDNLLLVSINYDRKNKKHSCVIEKYA